MRNPLGPLSNGLTETGRLSFVLRSSLLSLSSFLLALVKLATEASSPLFSLLSFLSLGAAAPTTAAAAITAVFLRSSSYI